MFKVKKKIVKFSKNDLTQFKKKGIPVEKVESQIEQFKNGFPSVKLIKSATINDGIKKLSEFEEKKYIQYFNSVSDNIKIIKFVPASGAATRMFKPFFDYLENQDTDSLSNFIKQINKIAFYTDLQKSLSRKKINIRELLNNKDYHYIINEILDESGLNYKNLPKGLIKFHQYNTFSRTAFEEHIIESENYCLGKNNEIQIHFTISPEHKQHFINAENELFSRYENTKKFTFNLSYSFQSPSTDTISVDNKNKPFRLQNGSILFRPAGHGALIDNLARINSDVIFIKNIDNIAIDKYQDVNNTYKKILGGYLVYIKDKINNYLKLLDVNKIDDTKISEILNFMEVDCLIKLPNEINNYSISNKVNYCFSKLDRPVRVCGMVRNEGQPGGGPFWVENNDKSISLQIVESAQICINDKKQRSIFEKSTHFNPVDIACNIQNKNFKNYDLLQFRNDNTAFISNKTNQGQELKALELPGLWNGSMDDWTTIFIEVPKETFNPVKTVLDLLNDGHQL